MNSLENELFTVALGLQPPWEVVVVRFDPEAGQIELEVGFRNGAKFECPVCEASGQPVHDTRQRRWRHLSFFQYQAFIQAKVPRVGCEKCGKTTQVVVPWARPESGFTALMEALALTLK